MLDNKVESLLKATGGDLCHLGDHSDFKGLSIDSRTLDEGDLFVCLIGENFDGHRFIAQAIEKRAAGILISHPETAIEWKEKAPFVVKVPDTLKALQDWAAHRRQNSKAKFICVTGSNGKSSTKEMVAAITKTQFETLKTEGNLNNHIGLPLTLSRLSDKHEVVVLEMGMSDKGEIATLANIAKPDIGILTNISAAHMTKLKSLKEIQAAKGELFESLGEDDLAVVNADDPLVLELAKNLRSRVVTYGIENDADVMATGIRETTTNSFDFDLTYYRQQSPFYMPCLGRFNLYNLLAAIAATGKGLGMFPERQVDAMATLNLMPQRLTRIEHKGVTLIDDTYNANPGSVSQAIDVLAKMFEAKRRFLVLGDMLELGEQEEIEHRKVASLIVERAIDVLVTVGSRARWIADSLREKKTAKTIMSFDGHREAAFWLRQNADEFDCLLFKGSRGAKMEKVISLFRQIEGGA